MSIITTAGRALRKIGERMESRPDKVNLWPSVADVQRRKRYTHGYQLYSGQHKAIFEPKRDERNHGPYIVANALKVATRVLSDRLVLETPVVSVADDDEMTDAMQQITEDSAWGRLLLRSTRGWSYRGDLIYRAVVRENALTGKPQVLIREVLPGSYFPEFDGDDYERLPAVSLCWERPARVDEGGVVREWWQREEYHTVGQYENRLYRLTATEDGSGRYNRKQVELSEAEEYADLLEVVPTDIDEIPIVHIPKNEIGEDMPWGHSDYEFGPQGQQQVINERATDHRTSLRKWSDPLMRIPLSYVTQKDSKQPKAFNAYGAKAITMMPGEEPPSYIPVPIENFPYSDQEAQTALRRLCMDVGVSPESFGVSDGNYPESGRAIRLRQVDTLSTVARNWVSLEPGLKRVISIASKLAAQHTGGPEAIEPEDIRIEHSDGLPVNEIERLEELTMRKALGESEEELARRMYPEWDEDAVQKELGRRKSGKPSFDVGLGGASRNAPPGIAERQQDLEEGADERAE